MGNHNNDIAVSTLNVITICLSFQDHLPSRAQQAKETTTETVQFISYVTVLCSAISRPCLKYNFANSKSSVLGDLNSNHVVSFYSDSPLSTLPFQDHIPSITLLTQRALSPGRHQSLPLVIINGLLKDTFFNFWMAHLFNCFWFNFICTKDFPSLWPHVLQFIFIILEPTLPLSFKNKLS